MGAQTSKNGLRRFVYLLMNLILDEMYLRFLRASPGETKFNVKSAFKVIKNYSVTLFYLFSTHIPRHGAMTFRFIPSASEMFMPNSTREFSLILEPSTHSFSLSLTYQRTKAGYNFLYMKPGLYFPSSDSLRDLLRSLVYLLECLTESEKPSTEGVAFMADMANWGTS
jgi:hypothetical protein